MRLSFFFVTTSLVYFHGLYLICSNLSSPAYNQWLCLIWVSLRSHSFILRSSTLNFFLIISFLVTPNSQCLHFWRISVINQFCQFWPCYDTQKNKKNKKNYDTLWMDEWSVIVGLSSSANVTLTYFDNFESDDKEERVIFTRYFTVKYLEFKQFILNWLS